MSNNKDDATYYGGDRDKPYDWAKDPGSGYADPVKVDPSLATPKPKKGRGFFFWFFLAVQALFIIWIITGIAGNASTPADTGGVLTQEDANSARDVGTTIGVFLIFVFWAIVDFLLLVGLFFARMTRRR